jgi:hypothetical protein
LEPVVSTSEHWQPTISITVPDAVDDCHDRGCRCLWPRARQDHRAGDECQFSTAFGDFEATAFCDPITGAHHLALINGDVHGTRDVLVRVHRECWSGDVFHTGTCGRGEQLDRSLGW